MRRLLALALLAACGGAGASSDQTTISNAKQVDEGCARMLRHVIDIGTVVPADGKPADQFVAEQCSNDEYLAYYRNLPAGTITCLLDAQTVPEGDECLGAMAYAEPVPGGVVCPEVGFATTGRAELEGVVRDRATGELLIGATVVAMPVGGDDEMQSVITDERGAYVFTDLAPAHYTLTVYYVDQSVTKTCVAAHAAQTASIDFAVPVETTP